MKLETHAWCLFGRLTVEEGVLRYVIRAGSRTAVEDLRGVLRVGSVRDRRLRLTGAGAVRGLEWMGAPEAVRLAAYVYVAAQPATKLIALEALQGVIRRHLPV